MSEKLKRAALNAALLLVLFAGPALAAGMFSGWPFAGGTQYPSTLPLTGDEGVAADTQLPSGLNPASELISVDQLMQGTTQSDSTATSHTAAAASVVGGAKLTLLLTGAPSTAVTLTTPTATAILAAMPKVDQVIGKTWVWKVVNQGGTSSGVWTIAGGTGVTITGNATAAVAGSREYFCAVTAVATPAITCTDHGN